mgnify:CR=1 FL=1
MQPTMAKWFKQLLLGSLIGLFGILVYLSPVGSALEEKFGLYGLFHLRGAVHAPDEVVVVAIDQPSATQLDLPVTPRLWPRDLHARLIDTLTAAGARIIIFDLIFDTPSAIPENDEKLAHAMKQAGNVVLIERLVYQDTGLPIDSDDQSYHRVIKEGPAPLLPIIADASKARATFPLPKAERVDDYWTFKENAGDIPTVPVIALQIFTTPIYGDFVRLLHTIHPEFAAQLPVDLNETDIEDLVLTLRNLFINEPRITPIIQAELNRDTALNASEKQMIHSLINLYAGTETRYLNFYGPPRSIKTVPYYQAVHLDKERSMDNPFGWMDFKDKVVFVGFSGATQPEQDIVRDDYHTVFSNPDGLFISGVEIAATAFANLLENKPVRPLPLPGSLVILFLSGLGIGIIFLALPKRGAITVGLIFTIFYIGSAYYLFREASIWLPLVNPVLLQIPLALFSAVSIKYYDAKRERQQLKEAFGKFVPERIVNDIARSTGPITLNNQLVYGACLATDAAMYTALAEKLDPRQLGQLMNEYYAVLFEPVKQHKGIVSDVIGDAMLAIWAAPTTNIGLRRQACLASLDIANAIDRFNQTDNHPQLPTRIGLHFGEMLLGNIGSMHHYEYRAVGDMVNTANRIQDVNKILGTRLLVSHEVITGLDEFLTRPLGNFLLPGKSTPVNLAELIAHRDLANDKQIWLCELFTQSLQAYQSQKWVEANQGFSEILRILPDDGPAHFFLTHCHQYKLEPPAGQWSSTLRITGK